MANILNIRAKKVREAKQKAKGIEPKPAPIITTTEDENTYLMMAATVSYQLGKFERAVRVYQALEILIPEWGKPVVGRGMALFRMGDIEGAELAYRKSVEIDAKDQEGHLYLGELLWQEHRDREGAMGHLSLAEALDPTSLQGRRATAMMREIEFQGQGR